MHCLPVSTRTEEPDDSQQLFRLGWEVHAVPFRACPIVRRDGRGEMAYLHLLRLERMARLLVFTDLSAPSRPLSLAKPVPRQSVLPRPVRRALRVLEASGVTGRP